MFHFETCFSLVTMADEIESASGYRFIEIAMFRSSDPAKNASREHNYPFKNEFAAFVPTYPDKITKIDAADWIGCYRNQFASFAKKMLRSKSAPPPT